MTEPTGASAPPATGSGPEPRTPPTPAEREWVLQREYLVGDNDLPRLRDIGMRLVWALEAAEAQLATAREALEFLGNTGLWQRVITDILEHTAHHDDKGFVRFHPESVIGGNLRRLGEHLARAALAQEGAEPKDRWNGKYYKRMREDDDEAGRPPCCWAILAPAYVGESENTCIQDRGHDDGKHEREGADG